MFKELKYKMATDTVDPNEKKFFEKLKKVAKEKTSLSELTPELYSLGIEDSDFLNVETVKGMGYIHFNFNSEDVSLDMNQGEFPKQYYVDLNLEDLKQEDFLDYEDLSFRVSEMRVTGGYPNILYQEKIQQKEKTLTKTKDDLEI